MLATDLTFIQAFGISVAKYVIKVLIALIDTIFIYDAIGILIGIFVCGKTMINTFYNVENMP